MLSKLAEKRLRSPFRFRPLHRAEANFSDAGGRILHDRLIAGLKLPLRRRLPHTREGGKRRPQGQMPGIVSYSGLRTIGPGVTV